VCFPQISPFKSSRKTQTQGKRKTKDLFWEIHRAPDNDSHLRPFQTVILMQLRTVQVIDLFLLTSGDLLLFHHTSTVLLTE
jgi:hypothetical protein